MGLDTKPSSDSIIEKIPVSHEMQENKPIELIFIIFSAYKLELIDLCRKYNCDFILEMKVYKVVTIEASKQEFEECCDKVRATIDKIKYCPVYNSNVEQNKGIKMLNSEHYNSLFKD